MIAQIATLRINVMYCTRWTCCSGHRASIMEGIDLSQVNTGRAWCCAQFTYVASSEPILANFSLDTAKIIAKRTRLSNQLLLVLPCYATLLSWQVNF